ncbi:dNA methylase family protein [Clostridium sp. CAG:632]|nr:dNA methylase family protein [Clostridium sp. CAG:632]
MVELLGYEQPEYCRTMEEIKASKSRIVITNYELVRDGDIRPDYFTATSLDEASVLRSFGSKTYQEFLEKFKGVPYKLVATATPSANKYKELIYYAGYLEVMDTGQALTRFFQKDSTKANNLTLYPNQEDEF